MFVAAGLEHCEEPHSVQEAVWLVVSSPAKKKVATSGNSRSSLRGFPVWGSLQQWGFCQNLPFLTSSQSWPPGVQQASPTGSAMCGQKPIFIEQQVNKGG